MPRLQEVADPLFGLRPGFAPASQIEHETRISKRFTAEAIGRSAVTAEEYFAVSESLLGGPAEESGPAGLVPIKRVAVRASAGPGALVAGEAARPYFGFDSRWLKNLTATAPSKLSIIRVEGDSMAPTLNTGDDILVDPSDCAERLRDGIYVLRVDEALIVKRIAIHPVGRQVTVQSDNPAYPDWPDCDMEKMACIGWVIWAGRRID